MPLSPGHIKEYHVFLASPGDMEKERKAVCAYFEQLNRHFAHQWDTRFEVIDWENYSSFGIDRTQEPITKQTLERFRDSLNTPLL